MESNDKSKKYLDLVSSAKGLFWKYGIKRVTIEEICNQAGVSKMTFYRFFENKTGIAKTILDDIVLNSINRFEEVVNSSIPFEDKVNRLLILKYEGSKNISFEFINDVYKKPELGLKQLMDDYTNKSLRMVIDFFNKAREKGEIRKDISIDFILAYINYTHTILNDEELKSKYDKAHDLIMEATRFLFYGIMPK